MCLAKGNTYGGEAPLVPVIQPLGFVQLAAGREVSHGRHILPIVVTAGRPEGVHAAKAGGTGAPGNLKHHGPR